MKSTNVVSVVPIELLPHPNADTLSIVKIGAYTCVVRTADWENVPIGAWVPPDNLVPTNRDEFSFLKKEGEDYSRIRAIKLRGVISFGLMIPAPEGAQVGDDVTEVLGVQHYNPPEDVSGGGDSVSVKGTALEMIGAYDVDSFQANVDVYEEGEILFLTEKVHGANARWAFIDGQMYAGSRTMWKECNDTNQWWLALQKQPTIESWCKSHPNMIVYGEVYGKVQSLKYGIPDTVDAVVFDIYDIEHNRYLDFEEARSAAPDLPWVPLIDTVVFSKDNLDDILNISVGRSVVSTVDQIREGVVVSTAKERWSPKLGRVKTKIVSPEYLMMK